ncbi:MAG: hypothetical protein IH827_06950 [Myxococcales bacterium]|nr:hypothetical protein [Myxococcales bacterium]
MMARNRQAIFWALFFPLMLVVGDQEVVDGTVTPRHRRGSKQSNEAVALDVMVSKLAADARERRVSRSED